MLVEGCSKSSMFHGYIGQTLSFGLVELFLGLTVALYHLLEYAGTSEAGEQHDSQSTTASPQQCPSFLRSDGSVVSMTLGELSGGLIFLPSSGNSSPAPVYKSSDKVSAYRKHMLISIFAVPVSARHSLRVVI